jgi:predicted acylesterase/phospholipase RssA
VALVTAPARKVAFLRSGGGMPGLWMALRERCIEATHCHGNSAGAIVSAFDALGHSSLYAMTLLDSLTDGDVRDEVFAWKLRVPWINHFLNSAPIEKLITQHLTLRMQRKGLTVYATELGSGAGRELSIRATDKSSRMAQCLLASMSICGVFPPVTLDGVELTDGGTSNNAAMPENWANYDEVWLLIAGGARDWKKCGEGIITRLMRNAWMYGRDQIVDAIERLGLSRANLEDRGWDAATLTHAHGNTIKVRALWPDTMDRGSLRFMPGLANLTHVWARGALNEMNREGLL